MVGINLPSTAKAYKIRPGDCRTSMAGTRSSFTSVSVILAFHLPLLKKAAVAGVTLNDQRLELPFLRSAPSLILDRDADRRPTRYGILVGDSVPRREIE